MKLNVVEIKVNSIHDVINPVEKIVQMPSVKFNAEVVIRCFFLDLPFEKEFVVASTPRGVAIHLKEDTSIFDEEKMDELIHKQEETNEDTFDETLFEVEELSPGTKLLIDALKKWIESNLNKIKIAGIKHPNQWVSVSKL